MAKVPCIFPALSTYSPLSSHSLHVTTVLITDRSEHRCIKTKCQPCNVLRCFNFFACSVLAERHKQISQENILADTHMAFIFVVTAVQVVVNEVWVHLSDHCLYEHQPINISIIYRIGGQDSAVGIATVRGSNPGGGEIFRTRSDRP